MGFCLFSFGYGMRFSRGAWLKWIVIFSFIFNVVLSYKANANPLLARVVLAEVFEGIVARRAAVSVVGRAAANDAAYLAANEAAIGLRAAQTYRALGTVAANDATFAVGATSTLRNAKDISWVALALTSGAITLKDLNVESNSKIGVAFEPTAVPLADGRYAINVNGETKVVNAMPSPKDPIIYQYSKEKKQISENSQDIYKSDVLDKHYKYFNTLRTGEYAQSNSIEKLAEYIAQEEWGGKGEENYSEVDIEGKKYRYLRSQTTVENRYLRHQKIGNMIYPEVRQIFTEKQLNYDFEPILEGNTGSQIVYSFNPPKPSDYEVSTRVNNLTYIRFEENQHWVGDFPTTSSDKQLNSVADLDLNLYTKPLTATQLALLYNALLMSAASQPGYIGVPFSASDPITSAEVQAQLNKLGKTATFADLFAKAGVGNQLSIGTSNQPQPIPQPTPNPGTRPGEEKDDKDIDDEPKYPELESPTARQILEPFNQFFPQLKNFHLADRAVQCPTWEGHIDYLNIDVRLDKHCQYVEQNKAVITSLILLIWGIVALRILLSA